MLTRFGSRCMILIVTLLVVSGICSAQQQPPASAPQPPTEPAVAPEAIAALEKMGGFLRTLKAFSLRADTTIDEVLDDTGQKIQFGGTIDFHVRQPDRLRADVVSDRKQRQFFFDGKTMILFGPQTKYYASVPAPPTIRDMLAVAEQKYGLELPLSDLFFWGTDKAHPEDIKTAIYVGPSWIGGVLCDHYGGYYGGYHPVATAAAVTAAATVTAAVVGSIVYSLPLSCSSVVVNGFTYQNCGGTWYQPQYAGSQVTYVVVNPPR